MLQFHNSGYGFATASEDKSARLYDIRSDQQIAMYKPPNTTSGFTSCGLSLSGRFLLAGSDDNSVHVWDTMKVQHNGKSAVYYLYRYLLYSVSDVLEYVCKNVKYNLIIRTEQNSNR